MIMQSIDPDRPATWPDSTRRWAEQHADRLAGSTVYLSDLAISLEQEDQFRATLGHGKVLAYHCTRLLPHEVEAIRKVGLRLLDEQLVRDRIDAARARDALSDVVRHRAETYNVFTNGNVSGRLNKVCFVLGRGVFDKHAAGGCDSLLRYWGGEAIRGGPSKAPELEAVGSPAVVVARLDLSRPHNDPYVWPGLATLFVGTLLGLDDRFAEVHYPQAVKGRDIDAIWQPGHPEYDRHDELPR